VATQGWTDDIDADVAHAANDIAGTALTDLFKADGTRWLVRLGHFESDGEGGEKAVPPWRITSTDAALYFKSKADGVGCASLRGLTDLYTTINCVEVDEAKHRTSCDCREHWEGKTKCMCRVLVEAKLGWLNLDDMCQDLPRIRRGGRPRAARKGQMVQPLSPDGKRGAVDGKGKRRGAAAAASKGKQRSKAATGKGKAATGKGKLHGEADT
jgi:hypothetical protein